MTMDRRSFLKAMAAAAGTMAGAASVAGLSGCSPQAKAGTLIFDDAGNREKRYLSLLAIDVQGHEHGAYERITAAYEEEFGAVKVIYDSVDAELYDVALERRIQTDNLDDIFTVDNHVAAALVDQGRLLDLTDHLSEATFNPFLVPHIQIQSGRYHFVPTTLDAQVLLVDLGQLTSRSLEAPHDLGELLDRCATMGKGHQTPIASSAAALAHGVVAGRGWWDLFQGDDPGAAMAALADDPRAVAEALTPGFEVLQRLLSTGCVSGPEARSATYAVDDAMVRGERPFAIGPLWLAPALIEADPSMDLVALPLPLREDGAVLPLEITGCLAVDALGDSVEDACRYLDFLLRQDVLARYDQIQSCFSPKEEGDWSPDDRSARCDQAVAQGAMTLTNSYLLRGTYDSALIESTEVLLGGSTVPEAVAVFRDAYGRGE